MIADKILGALRSPETKRRFPKILMRQLYRVTELIEENGSGTRTGGGGGGTRRNEGTVRRCVFETAEAASDRHPRNNSCI